MKTTITPRCFAFAAHLSDTATPEFLSRSHNAMDADASDLKKWKLSRREWSLAVSAVVEARKTGKTPEDFLKSTQDLLNQLSNGNCELSFVVGGAIQRNE